MPTAAAVAHVAIGLAWRQQATGAAGSEGVSVYREQPLENCAWMIMAMVYDKACDKLNRTLDKHGEEYEGTRPAGVRLM